MRICPRVVWLATAAGALALAGCGDPTAPLTPADVTGTYVLASVGGIVPPIPFGTGTTIVADTVRYSADSAWTSTTVSGLAGGGLTATGVGRWSGTWRLDPSRATLHRIQRVQGNDLVTVYRVQPRGRVLESTDVSGQVWRYMRAP